MPLSDAMEARRGKAARALVLIGFCLYLPQTAVAGELSDTRKQDLAYLLEQDCGSCHGLTLKGGLGSPLTAEALQGKSAEYLFAVIRNGIPGTPMPPWSPLLEDSDIRWIVQLLQPHGTPQ